MTKRELREKIGRIKKDLDLIYALSGELHELVMSVDTIKDKLADVVADFDNQAQDLFVDIEEFESELDD